MNGASTALSKIGSADGGVSEATLSAAERMLRKITEASADYLALLDLNLRVLFLNRGLARRTAQQLEGRHITEFMPQNVHPAAIACMRRVLETRCPDRYEGQIAMPGGELRHFEFRVSPVVEEDAVVGLTLNGSDMTEYRQAERAIATQAKMIESMLEGVAVLTASGAIEITNPAFDGIFGRRRGELIGQRLNTLSDSDSDVAEEDSLSDLAALVGKRDSIPLEFEGRHADGSRLAVAGVLSRFAVAGNNRYLAVLQDVSERKALERAILEAANREQYRIGNDLHDGLGQELTGIALMLKGVATRMAKEHPAVLPDIDSIARLVSNAVESTRALARGLSPVNLERGGLIDALEGLAMHARDLYGTQVSFVHRLRSTAQISAELGNHFYRIAQEAVTNAVRHGQAHNIAIQLGVSRGKIRMSIADDGRGLPVDALDAPGMGLKIMQHRARISGGTVHFESPAGGGMRIVCECPLQPPRLGKRGKTRKRTVAAQFIDQSGVEKPQP